MSARVRLTPEEEQAILNSEDGLKAFIESRARWYEEAYAHNRKGKQIPPSDGDWLLCLLLSGRGFGKTRAETEWLFGEMARIPNLIGHAVAPTLGDLKKTLMVEGPASFKAIIPPECLKGGSWETAYTESDWKIELWNGSRILGFGAVDGGGKLRGPQCHAAIADELREWDKPAGALREAFSNLEFGVRLPYPDGTPSRIVAGTTPKNIAFLKDLQRQAGTIVVRGTSYENAANLAESYKRRLFAKEGTVIGRVEIHAEEIGNDELTIFKTPWIRLWPPDKALPEFVYVLMSMDTAMEEENRDLNPGQGRQPKIDFSATSILGVFNVNQVFTEAERKKYKVRSKYAALVADFWMERLGFPQLLEAARKSYRTKYGPRGRNPRYPNLVLIENKSSGISLRQTMMTWGVPCAPFDPMGQSKTLRAHAVSPLVMQGMLWMPESDYRQSGLEHRKGMVRNWCEPLFNQLTEFSGEGSIEFDDGLDTITQGMLYLSQAGYFHAEPEGLSKPDPDEKTEQEQREALRIADQKKRGRNPYAA